MDIEEIPVYTVIRNDGSAESLDGNGTNEENNVIYFTLDEGDNEIDVEANETEETTSYLVQDDSVIQPINSTVFNPGVKIVTVDNERYFYIATDDDENVQSIEPHLITCQDSEDQEGEECQTEDNTIENESDQAQIGIKVIEPYQMIMLNDVDEESEVALENIQKKFKCLYMGCEQVYSTSQHLTVHMRNHMKRKPYNCTFQGCGKNFATNYSLTAHWRTHTGEKPYTCQICSKSFKTSGDLQKHVRIHTGEKPFVCPISGCGKSFTTSNIRKVHIRSHTGERPYVCDYPNCGKAFASSTNFKNHSRIHSGEKPFACSVKGCDKKFTEYSSLYKHNAVHQVEKPHECNYCKQKFKSEHTLNVHRKVKHGVLVSPEGIQLLDLAALGLSSTSLA